MTKSEYSELLKDPRWLDRRAALLLLRGTACEDCGAEGPVEVHHGYYRAGRKPWEYPDSAFHVLCRGCHMLMHPDKHNPVAPLVAKLAARFSMETHLPPPDPRAKLWEIAHANERAAMPASMLMQALSWLYYKNGVKDFRILEKAARAMVQARNPYALTRRGGKAYESFVSDSARDRAVDEKAAEFAADMDAGLGRSK